MERARWMRKQELNVVVPEDFSDDIGVQPPLGFWDPLNMLGDEKKYESLRYCEKKHGI